MIMEKKNNKGDKWGVKNEDNFKFSTKRNELI